MVPIASRVTAWIMNSPSGYKQLPHATHMSHTHTHTHSLSLSLTHSHILSLPSLPLPHPQSHISQSHSHQPQGVNSWYQLYHCKQEKHTEASQRHVNLAQLILYKFLAVWNHMATHGNTTDTNLTWYLQNLSSLNPQNDKFLPEFCLQIFKINNYW